MYDLFLIVCFAFSIFHVSYWGYKHNQLLYKKRELDADKESTFHFCQRWKDDLAAWERDLYKREKVWKEFKQKVEKDLKWNWKI